MADDRKALPPAERAIIVQEVFTQVSRSFSGPLPPPEILAQYNRIFPGCAERIVKMAEEQSRHRQGLESGKLGNDELLARRGQVLGFVLAFVMLVGGIVLAYFGKSVAGLTVIGTTVGSILGVAWYGKKAQREELEAQAKALAEAGQPPG